jgi:hypothetical protein
MGEAVLGRALRTSPCRAPPFFFGLFEGVAVVGLGSEGLGRVGPVVGVGWERTGSPEGSDVSRGGM